MYRCDTSPSFYDHRVQTDRSMPLAGAHVAAHLAVVQLAAHLLEAQHRIRVARIVDEHLRCRQTGQQHTLRFQELAAGRKHRCLRWWRTWL